MIYVVLPAYNEERGLASLLARIREVSSAGAERTLVVVVDDGSGDETPQVVRGFARTLDIWLVSHVLNEGPGAALRTGLELVLKDSADPGDVAVTMHADDTHDPALVPMLVRALRKRGADVALASRFALGGGEVGVPFRLRWLDRVARLCCRAAAPMEGVRDYTSGFGAFRVEALRSARAAAGRPIPAGAGSAAYLELLLRARAVGAGAVEVPLVLRYDRKESRCRTRLAPTVASALALLAKAVTNPPARAAEPASPASDAQAPLSGPPAPPPEASRAGERTGRSSSPAGGGPPASRPARPSRSDSLPLRAGR